MLQISRCKKTDFSPCVVSVECKPVFSLVKYTVVIIFGFCCTLVAEYIDSIGWGCEAASDDMFIMRPFPLEVNKSASFT